MLKVVEPLIPKAQQRNEEMASELEKVAAMLRSGELSGFHIAFEFTEAGGGGYGYKSMGLSCEQKIALLRRIEHRIMLDWDREMY